MTRAGSRRNTRVTTDRPPGPIRVRLTRDADALRLVVADSGSGTVSPGKGFGSRMIAAMVAQLGGTLTYEDNEPGLRATLTAPLEASGRG